MIRRSGAEICPRLHAAAKLRQGEPMAAGRVNPSVEQINASSGWDEAKKEAESEERLVLVSNLRPKKIAELPPADLEIAGLHPVEDQLRAYLDRIMQSAERFLVRTRDRINVLRQDRPGTILIAAAILGFGCGVLLRRRISAKTERIISHA
jgi:hypothetical protein